jgi:hypothetical protein
LCPAKKDIAESPAIAPLTEIVIDAQRICSWHPKKHLCKSFITESEFSFRRVSYVYFFTANIFSGYNYLQIGCVCLIEISVILFNEVPSILKIEKYEKNCFCGYRDLIYFQNFLSNKD